MAKPPNLTRCPLFSCFVSNLTNRRIKATSHIVYIQTTSYIPDKMNKKRLWALPSCKIGFAVVYYPRQERECLPTTGNVSVKLLRGGSLAKRR